MGRQSKNYSAREKKQGRCFACVLYDDSEEYQIEYILNRLSYYWDSFYYIRHDRDVYQQIDVDKYIAEHDDDCPFAVGDLKKPHYHVIGYSSNPCLLGRAATNFGISSNYVQPVSNKKAAIQYFIHLNAPEKWQYTVDEIVTNDSSYVNSVCIHQQDSSTKARQLLEYISSSDCISFMSLCSFAIDNGLWDELRRGQHIYSNLLREVRQYESKNCWN